MGVAVVLLSKPEEFQIPLSSIGYQIHPSRLIILAAALGTYAVKRLDLGVYHRMLRGAVAFGENLEKELIRRRVLPIQEGMTQSISRFSRETKPGKPGTTAEARIGWFYTLLISTLLVIGFLMLFATAKPLAEPSPAGAPPAQELSVSGDP